MKMNLNLKKATLFSAIILIMGFQPILANTITVPVFFTAEHGFGKVAGTITIQETMNGLLFTPNLQGLKPGLHGFHIHQSASCENHGMASGGHFDPQNTNKHLGPYNDNGHLGDLPVLYVTSDGSATIPVFAPRLKTIKEINDHAIIIHDGGDNYSDKPKKLGGGEGRMICGVIKENVSSKTQE